MDKTIARQWIEDLRANPDKQTQNVLCEVTDEGDKFCCMGRLGLLIDPKGFDTPPITDDLNGGYRTFRQFKYEQDGPEGKVAYSFTGYLPCVTLLQVGMTSLEQSKYATYNDAGQTFAQIADEIERTEFPNE